MNYIVRSRGTGKTTELIYISSIRQIPILTLNCERIKRIAKELGVYIPEPIPYSSYEEYYRGRDVESILIDDLDLILPEILENYFGKKVDGVVMSSK